jgi:hypothetical protein
MSIERNANHNRSRNYEVCRGEEVYVGADTECTIPASMYIGALSSENRRDYDLGITSYLKLIVEKPCDQTDGSAVMVYEVDSRVSGRTDGNLYMLSEDDLGLARMVASVDDLERLAQSIPEDGTEVKGPTVEQSTPEYGAELSASKNSFKVKSNSQGDVIVIGCSEAGTLLIAPGQIAWA